jgi:hypothetical protein
MFTVDNIQSRVASILDQDQDTSNISAADYSLRLTYIQMAVSEWSEIANWQVLYKEFNMNVSTSTGNASIVAPSDFRKIASFPVISWTDNTTDTFSETKPQDALTYDVTDKRVEILGNTNDGYVMRVYGATLISGASVKLPYFATPASLTTSTSVTEMPSIEYVVKRTLAYWWEAREDGRFIQAKQESDRILQNLIEREFTHSQASDYNRVKTYEETRNNNFRPGRD